MYEISPPRILTPGLCKKVEADMLKACAEVAAKHGLVAEGLYNSQAAAGQLCQRVQMVGQRGDVDADGGGCHGHVPALLQRLVAAAWPAA